MKIRSAVPENGCLIFLTDGKKQKKTKNKKKQESCAIAKMTAQCALHMGAMKIFGTP